MITNMLLEAEKYPASFGIHYLQVDFESIVLEGKKYDFVLSGLALHCMEDLERLLKEGFKASILGGMFVFSIKHPFMLRRRIRNGIGTQNH
jgi:ubiquinone/menaquinone biosynthesis C-methylase UbiE